MTIRRFRQGGFASLAAVVTVALSAIGAPVAWAAPAASAKPSASLEVQSAPSGAAVYVDGRWTGETPVAVAGITSGDHTVRLVKEGFLENRRVVSVPASGRSLHVTLTSTAAPLRALARLQAGPSDGQPEPGGEPEPAVDAPRGNGRKWRWIGLGAAALTGIGVGVYVATKNDPPKVSGVTASPQIALQGATEVALAASASDPNKDTLTYTWDFGDGATASGASVSHVFASAGPYTVSVAVSDGKEKATGTTSVTVKSMAGPWTGSIENGASSVRFSLNLVQNGATVAGNYAATYPTYGPVQGTVTGNVLGPGSVSMTVNVHKGTVYFHPLIFTGALAAGMDSASGSVTENGVPFTFSLKR